MLVAGGSLVILQTLSRKLCACCLRSVRVKMKWQDSKFTTCKLPQLMIYNTSGPKYLNEGYRLDEKLYLADLVSIYHMKKMQRAKIIIPLQINHRKADRLAWKGYNLAIGAVLDVLGLTLDGLWIQDHGNIQNRCFDYQVKRASGESQTQKGTLTVQLHCPVDHLHPSNRRHCNPKAELFVLSFCFLRSLHPSATADLVTLAGSIISGSIIDKEKSLMHIRGFCDRRMCMAPRLLNKPLEHILVNHHDTKTRVALQ